MIEQQSETIDFGSLAKTLSHYHATILPDILSGGKMVGKEWVCGDITGTAGNSFKFNVETGVFKDFASNEGGKDIIALYSKQRGISMKEAAIYLRDRYIGNSQPIVKYNYPVKKDQEKQIIIEPPIDTQPPEVPAGAKMWCYKSATGNPLYYIVRVDPADGKKFFYPLSFTNKDLWVKKQYTHPVPYNLDKIAEHLTKPILIVEGEKAADAASQFMSVYTVTTWHGGAQSWLKTEWSYLKGRKILCWPDADDVGRKAMNDLALHLLNEVGVFELKMLNSDKTDGWDAYDCFLVDKNDYKSWANWAKPLVTLHTKKQKVEVIPEDQYEIPANDVVSQDEVDGLIPTEDFPVSPNMQMKFIDMGLQFSDSKRTRVVMNASNVAKILRTDFKDIVWRDVFYGKVFTKWRTGVERQWSDNDTNNLFIQMQHHYELGKLSKQHVQDAVEFVASMNEKNEPQEWLQSLKWDGEHRIERFFTDAMGAEDSEYTKAVSKNFWIALAARIMQAGCKADEMVVLEGRQGTYKTTSLEIIGGKWYGEVNSDIASKDFDQGLKGKILVEFGELANLKKADVEIIKRKLSTRIDEYRPSYGRYVEMHPRTCIFVGTTNESEYLKDPTGNRRFWPMKIVRADTDYIKKYREQFFAEALSRFNAGEKWHEVPWEDAEKIRAERIESDDLSEAVLKILDSSQKYKTTYFTALDIWLELGETPVKFIKKEQKRMGAILTYLGYENKTFRLNGKPTRGWVKK